MKGLMGDEALARAAFRRIASLVDLDADAVALLAHSVSLARSMPARGELLREGTPIAAAQLILAGWAARIRQLEDGRRQIVSFLLPGDLIGSCAHEGPIAVSSVIALTTLHYCPAPPSSGSRSLERAYALSGALDEAHLLDQVTRLGRLNAEERILDLFLELYERLSLCGLADQGQIVFPLTQEMLADATGLTQVHVNRMLQILRKRGDITLNAGSLAIIDPVALAGRVGRAPTKVTSLRLPVPAA